MELARQGNYSGKIEQSDVHLWFNYYYEFVNLCSLLQTLRIAFAYSV
ncbi:hypothetical protein SAMN06265348_104389 [Pedobacter westerhofensis]|uniref:Uncharacterized protein n=1 Tax=Pedobacter westerhofensis TaxID=425512 RepID=A0A521D225_9SPHI|nr:hypothetical protein SAMN06265348_104389 [Pedobacter westerhofensis]